MSEIPFWLAAVVFSLSVRGISTLDLFFDSVPGVAVLVSFPIGAHMANNILQLGGYVKFFTVISQDPLLLTVTAVVFGSFTIWTIQGLIGLFTTGSVEG